jgi:hypothetical protein
MSTIYCDEAGNTGANLLDPEQPFFILASNDFSADEANALLEHVRSIQGGEPKFSTLRRRPEGVARVIRLLSDPRLNRERVSIDVYHKRYMVVTKMVDLIAETLIHDIGGDLYERGANIAMSNLLYFCMPTFCGEEKTSAFLQAFVDLIRHGPDQYKAPFYEAGRQLLSASTHEGFKEDLFYFTEPVLFDKWYLGFNWSALDPAIPALFHQILVWGRRKGHRFNVLHDHSKPILASQETFESMMAEAGEASKTMGGDRRTIEFPLRASSLSQGDSSMYPQLQVADLCAGAMNHFYKCHISGESDDLSEAVEALGCLDWGSDFLLPQPHVTPEALGTVGPTGSNAVEGITEYLLKKKSGK